MSGVAHVVARAVVDDPHTLGVVALAAAMNDGSGAPVYAARGARTVKEIDDVARLDRADPSVIVYHQRGAAPALVSRLTRAGARLAVLHDGPAPDPLAARDLQVLAAAEATGLATSDAGAARLDDAGFGAVQRVAPVVARDQLAAVAAFPGTANHVAVALHGPLILTVDDVATATNAARVVQAYHVLRTYLARTGNLTIAVAGSDETDDAAVRSVFRETWGLRLVDAWALRLLNAGERAALTRGAAVFVTADPASGDVRHALAAMAEGVPVVAPADASAADLLGDGALLLPHDASAALLAEALADVLHDESRRTRLATAARRNVARFAPEVVAPAWRAAVAA